MLTDPVMVTKAIGTAETIVAHPGPRVNCTVANVFSTKLLATFPQKVSVLVGVFCGNCGMKLTTVTVELPPIVAWVTWMELTKPLRNNGEVLLVDIVARRWESRPAPQPSSPRRSTASKPFIWALLRAV